MALTGSRYDSLQVDHLVFGCPERRLLRVLHGGMIGEMGGQDQTPRSIWADATAKQARHRAVPGSARNHRGDPPLTITDRPPRSRGEVPPQWACGNGCRLLGSEFKCRCRDVFLDGPLCGRRRCGAGDGQHHRCRRRRCGPRTACRERALACGERRNMPISNRDISSVLTNYLKRYPEEAALLSEPLWLLP